jgi:hypothetical protein
MNKVASSLKRKKTKELEPYNRTRIDVTKFKPDLSPRDLQALFRFPGGLNAFFFLTIDTLSITKTTGNGRTNLTFIEPTIVQADAATPFASFDRQLSPTRNPTMQMHFEPKAYGITSTSSFFMNFAIECFGQCTFKVDGFAGSGTLSNAGNKVVNGKSIVTLGFHNVPPGAQTFGFVEQTAGRRWSVFSVRARFPSPVVSGG